jgi:hypothetical protein
VFVETCPERTAALIKGNPKALIPGETVDFWNPTIGVLTALDWAMAWVEKAAPATKVAKEIFKLFIDKLIRFFAPFNQSHFSRFARVFLRKAKTDAKPMTIKDKDDGSGIIVMVYDDGPEPARTPTVAEVLEENPKGKSENTFDVVIVGIIQEVSVRTNPAVAPEIDKEELALFTPITLRRVPMGVREKYCSPA